MKGLTQAQAAMIKGRSIDHGSHDDADDGMCVMEMVSYMQGHEFSAEPPCVSEIIRDFMIGINDSREVWVKYQMDEKRQPPKSCVRSGPYGTMQAWAAYERNKLKAVIPDILHTAPTYVHGTLILQNWNNPDYVQAESVRSDMHAETDLYIRRSHIDTATLIKFVRKLANVEGGKFA